MALADCTSVSPVAPYTTNNILEDLSKFLCLQCASVCDGCVSASNDIRDCSSCVPGSNRAKTGTLTSITSPPTCICQAGFVEVNGAVICQRCSDLIPGCSSCLTSTYCDFCVAPTSFSTAANTTHRQCTCPTGTYLVTGICLSYPGCLVANIYITG